MLIKMIRKSETNIVCQDLDTQYPPNPSDQIDSIVYTNLFTQLFSVIAVPPKSVKCPIVCFCADRIRLLKPSIKISGMSQTAIPNNKKVIFLFLTPPVNF